MVTVVVMCFKRKIRKRVYALYLNGVCLINIAEELKLSDDDVEEIIDYMNEIYT
jgi:hypothetical protein